VIGYALKEEKNQYQSRWKEYTLYNAAEGFAFLSEYNGHWIYIREQGNAPIITKTAQTLHYNGKYYELFNRYTYLIVNAQGEFPYNIFNPDGTDVREFIAPPEVWIQELSKREGITWFRGEHIEGREVKNNFDLPAGLPEKIGIGAVEPKITVNKDRLVMMTIAGIVFLVIVHILNNSFKQSRELVNGVYSFNDSTNVVTLASQKFTLDKWRSNLRFDVEAPVDNSWFELNTTLVNAATGTEYSISQGVEYYYGTSEGESWSEGSRDAVAYLGQIPAGTYFLQVTGQRESSFYNRLREFRLRVRYDVSTTRNMWLCLLLLLIWPVVQYFRTNNIEKQRWYNSPFSSYDS
jgi:hypothetical protein